MTNDSWDPCPEGTIQKMVQDADRTNRSGILTRRAAMLGATVTVVGTGLLLADRLASGTPLTCDQVRALAQRYVSGTLNGKQTAQVDRHRAECNACNGWLIQLAQI